MSTPTDDELRDAVDHIQGAVEFQDAINPEAVRVVISAALRRTEVPEPSAECASCQGECGGGRHCCENCVHTQPQGEPSDSQVLAALNAFYDAAGTSTLSDYSLSAPEAMRAALRAAGEVR